MAEIFICHQRATVDLARSVALKLGQNGHHAFLADHDLGGGSEFDARIRQRIRKADFAVVLLTPAAVAGGAYVLSEIRMIEERWPSGAGRVIPVEIEPTAHALLPPYIGNLTIVKPEGDPATDVVSFVQRAIQDTQSSARRPAVLLALVGAGVLAIAAAVYLTMRGGSESERTPPLGPPPAGPAATELSPADKQALNELKSVILRIAGAAGQKGALFVYIEQYLRNPEPKEGDWKLVEDEAAEVATRLQGDLEALRGVSVNVPRGFATDLANLTQALESRAGVLPLLRRPPRDKQDLTSTRDALQKFFQEAVSATAHITALLDAGSAPR